MNEQFDRTKLPTDADFDAFAQRCLVDDGWYVRFVGKFCFWIILFFFQEEEIQ